MLFSDHPRTSYNHAPVREVICQLRFPTILSINQNEPADFQESIRETFPRYMKREDMPAPRVRGLGTPNMQVETPPPVSNYHFLSEDGTWKLNLTRDFIALSTVAYPGWEKFTEYLDQPLASFIRIYNPAYFQRVGLRYLNVISREKLGIENIPWSELFTAPYTGALQEEDVRESNCITCSCELGLKLDSSCQVKIHAGPGQVKSNAPGAKPDPELQFIFDMDLFMGGDVSCTLAAAALETLHGHADRIFEGAITDTLREAIEP